MRVAVIEDMIREVFETLTREAEQRKSKVSLLCGGEGDFSFARARRDWCLRLAQEMSVLPERDTDLLCAAAWICEIGELTIPQSILLKSEPLNDDDWTAIKRHPNATVQMLKERLGHFFENQDDALKELSSIILHHHPWYEGDYLMNGDTRISLESQILSVCLAFVAMRYDKPGGRFGMDRGQALEAIKKEIGKKFSAQVVLILQSLLQRDGVV